MQNYLFLSMCLVLLGFTGTAISAENHMKIVAEAQGFGTYFSPALPEGYTDEALKARPKIRGKLRRRLGQLEYRAKRKWARYVMDNDDEYGDLSEKERQELARNPKKEFGEKYLVKISDFHAVYYKRKLIGYEVSLDDLVQSTIFQDGAGYVIYVDSKMNIVHVEEWAA